MKDFIESLLFVVIPFATIGLVIWFFYDTAKPYLDAKTKVDSQPKTITIYQAKKVIIRY